MSDLSEAASSPAGRAFQEVSRSRTIEERLNIVIYMICVELVLHVVLMQLRAAWSVFGCSLPCALLAMPVGPIGSFQGSFQLGH